MAYAGPFNRLYLEQRHLHLPVRELRTSVRRYLAVYLNPPTSDCTASGVIKNWEGLAELVGFDARTIKTLNEGPVEKTKTMGLFEKYGDRGNPTVGHLLEKLKELERFDILEDNVPFELIRRDCEVYEENLPTQTQALRPIQVAEVSTTPFITDDWTPARHMEENEDTFLVIDGGDRRKFDAFVSFSEEDLPFVNEMTEILERRHGLRLCFNLRNLLPGVAIHHATAKLIAERCNKVILVLSPNFVDSAECDFQTRVALALSPGAKMKILIPILYQPCNLPIVLNHVCLVDYTKVDLVDWFWWRLAASLRSNSAHLPDADLESLDSISLFEHEGLSREEQPSSRNDMENSYESSVELPVRSHCEARPQQTHSQDLAAHTRPNASSFRSLDELATMTGPHEISESLIRDYL